MAVPFTRLASQAISNYNRKLNDSLKAYNGIVAILGSRGRIKSEVGGTSFSERVLYGQNTNVGFRGKNATIPTVDDEGITMAEVDHKVCSGSVVINRVERDQVKGSWAIGRLLEDKMMQAETTWVQKWAEVLLQASPGANDPFTLLPSATSGTINGILSPVAPASAAGTTAGISRADNDWWRNQYTNTAIDISTEAGDSTLYQEAYVPCIFGNSKLDTPNFGLADAKSFGDLYARGDTNKRGTLADQGMLKLGFDNLMYYNATMIRETDTQMVNKIVFLNTRDLAIKYLQSPGIKNVDQSNNLGSIPVIVDGFQKDIDSLNMVATMYIVASLVPSLLRTHGLADNIA